MSEGEKKGFDTDKYLEAQQKAFDQALTRDSGDSMFIEFGGKPFFDRHAERVLPGYDAECKAEILKQVVKMADVVMVVNALDVLQRPDGRTLRGRIRGDTNLMYDAETLRLIEDASNRNIPITKVVMAVTPSAMSTENRKLIDGFRMELERHGVRLLTHNLIEGYPDPKMFDDGANPFAGNEQASEPGGNLVAISPGGGSGKFGMILSEMYGALARGETPSFVKFETFPIYQLDADHALNMAFEAATADLKNKVLSILSRGEEPRTSYDKDIQNFIVLSKMFEVFGKTESISHMSDAVDMGINRIIDGITDMEIIVKACHAEICNRILRYKGEQASGIETMETVALAEQVLGRFERLYQIQVPRASDMPPSESPPTKEGK